MMRGLIRKIMLAILPDSELLRFLAYKPKFETWRKGLAGKHPVFSDRQKMYDFINGTIVGNQPIEYLEFGVFRGESILYFARIHANPKSRFIGFDTFEGLPEAWSSFSRNLPRETFSTGGELPRTDDPRVSFIKGLFQETLPGYLAETTSSRQLVLHNDSDLYSSTLYVLTRANDVIRPGSIIIFDEFYSPLHEFRAFDDYCCAYTRKYEVIAATKGHGQVAIRML